MTMKEEDKQLRSFCLSFVGRRNRKEEYPKKRGGRRVHRKLIGVMISDSTVRVPPEETVKNKKDCKTEGGSTVLTLD
jgi:hypothetical protein